MNGQAGKGGRQRPVSISHHEWAVNYDRIFRKRDHNATTAETNDPAEDAYSTEGTAEARSGGTHPEDVLGQDLDRSE